MPRDAQSAQESPLTHPKEPHRTARFGLRIRRPQVRVLPSALLNALQIGSVRTTEWSSSKIGVLSSSRNPNLIEKFQITLIYEIQTRARPQRLSPEEPLGAQRQRPVLLDGTAIVGK